MQHLDGFEVYKEKVSCELWQVTLFFQIEWPQMTTYVLQNYPSKIFAEFSSQKRIKLISQNDTSYEKTL